MFVKDLRAAFDAIYEDTKCCLVEQLVRSGVEKVSDGSVECARANSRGQAMTCLPSLMPSWKET